MKKVILTEEQVRYLMNEDLGIAKEVVKLTNIIEKDIYTLLEKNIKEKKFRVATEMSDLYVDFMFKYFNSTDEFYVWHSKTHRNNGYSFEENTLYLTVLQFGNKIDYYDLTDTIQHECSHYWECKMKNKPISTDRYQDIIKGMSNNNPIVAYLCKILYYCNKNEINSFVNGAYASAMKKKKEYKTYKDFIYDNLISDLYSTLKNSYDNISKYNSQNTLFITACWYLINHNIIKNYENFDKTKKYFQTVSKNGFKYLIRKVGMAYSLYMVKMEEEREKERDWKFKEILRQNGL